MYFRIQEIQINDKERWSGIKHVQDEEKRNENTTQYVMDTSIRKQPQIT